MSLVTPIHSYDPFAYHWPELEPLFPLPSEPHVTAWRQYEAEAVNQTALETLRPKLIQLSFPIEAGISQTAAYRTAMQRGTLPDFQVKGLKLEQPNGLRLFIHSCLAGDIPVLLPATRADFCVLVQAITQRNEPTPIPSSMGACLVSDYNNWDRVRTYQRQWLTSQSAPSQHRWPEAAQALLSQKSLYQDRFIILSQGEYSDVPANAVGLETEAWRLLSLQIRLHHECAHYLTKRIFGVIRQHLHDELLADYAAMVATIGYFRADWFLLFMGLENYPHYRNTGRLENYLATSHQNPSALADIHATLVAAAHNLECFDQALFGQQRTLVQQGAVLCALAGTSLADLARPNGVANLANATRRWSQSIKKATPKTTRPGKQTLSAAVGGASILS